MIDYKVDIINENKRQGKGKVFDAGTHQFALPLREGDEVSIEYKIRNGGHAYLEGKVTRVYHRAKMAHLQDGPWSRITVAVAAFQPNLESTFE